MGLSTANLQTCHPDIPFDDLNLRISDDLIPLGQEFCAAVNSFGYGGSNAHVVLQTAPKETQNNTVAHSSESAICGDEQHPLPYFLPLSTRNPKALAALAGSYAELLNDSHDLHDVLYSASHKRAHLSHRAVISGRSRSELIRGLEALRDGRESTAVVQNTVPYDGNPRQSLSSPVWALNGGRWASNSIANSLSIARQSKRPTRSYGDRGWSILHEMLKSESESRITQTEYAQPANFMVQIGLLETLRAAGYSLARSSDILLANCICVRSRRTVIARCTDGLLPSQSIASTCRGTGGMLVWPLTKTRSGIDRQQ